MRPGQRPDLGAQEHELYQRVIDTSARRAMGGDDAAVGAAYQILTKAPSPRTARGRQMMRFIESLKMYYGGLFSSNGDMMNRERAS